MKKLTPTLSSEKVASGGWLIFHIDEPKIGLIITDKEYKKLRLCEPELLFESLKQLFPDIAPYKEIFRKWKTKRKTE